MGKKEKNWFRGRGAGAIPDQILPGVARKGFFEKSALYGAMASAPLRSAVGSA